MQVRDLRRRYGGGPLRAEAGFEAVRGVSFDVARGELFALLGTNGAGKTSTMEVAEGLAAPSAGEVRVLGCDPYSERAALRPRIGIMLQQGGFPGDLTVAEVARMWAGTMRAPRPTAEVLDAVGLGHRVRVACSGLSGGERRRLDLALALMGRPEVLFLDEPTTGLDPESRRTTWALVRDLVDDGTTVLLTTHYLDEADELADRLAIMHDGEVVLAGRPDEVVAGFPSEIRWQHVPGTSPPQLPDASTAVEGTRVVLRTERLRPTLARLLAWADDADAELPGLAATSASLETVFLAVADGARPTATRSAATGPAGTRPTATRPAGTRPAGIRPAGTRTDQPEEAVR